MELAIIGRRLCEPLTGVGRYLEYLLQHWARDSRFSRIVVFTPSEPNLRMEEFGPPVEWRVIPSRLPPLLWENLVLPPKMGGFELIFAPYTLPWSLAEGGAVSNLGIYESRPGDFSFSERLRSTPFFHHSCRQARLVLANSASTRGDLIPVLRDRPIEDPGGLPRSGPGVSARQRRNRIEGPRNEREGVRHSRGAVFPVRWEAFAAA